MKSKMTEKKLKALLFVCATFAFIQLIGLFTNMLLSYPLWITLSQCITLLLFLVLIAVIALDLVKQDVVTIKGNLVEKNVYTVGISIGNEKVKKFRANEEFKEKISELQLQQEIEIKYYRRTKAVTEIN